MSRRVDAHFHVWRLDRGDYGWLKPTPELARICRDFGLSELRPLLAAAHIDATVLVQAAPTLSETRFLLDVARDSEGLVQAVVGWVDLGGAGAIETLGARTEEPLLKGVRPMLQDLADSDWIARPDVQPALAALPQLGLRFDALVKPSHLRSLLRTLEHHPDLEVVIDHCAKPDISGQQWRPWADDLAALAHETRACCKLSGLVTEAGARWSVETLRRYADHVLDCFGPTRVLWGSDWPVVDLAGGYRRWVAATDALLAGLSADDRQAIRGGNARRFYGLG